MASTSTVTLTGMQTRTTQIPQENESTQHQSISTTFNDLIPTSGTTSIPSTAKSTTTSAIVTSTSAYPTMKPTRTSTIVSSTSAYPTAKPATTSTIVSSTSANPITNQEKTMATENVSSSDSMNTESPVDGSTNHGLRDPTVQTSITTSSRLTSTSTASTTSEI